MSSYLVDECPDDMNWEDFDPDVDGLRAEINDLLESRQENGASPGSITHG